MTKKIIKKIDDLLILRHATSEDVEEIAAFNASIHSDDGPDKPDKSLAHWTRDLFTKQHPTFDIEDFAVIEDTSSKKIVSVTCTFSQTWAYEGIPFGVGRPELIATHPDYRRRGLIRHLMDTVHAWSEARGEKMQAITGIPWFYRQFGYEMALELGGGRMGYKPHVPKLKNDDTEPFIIREAAESDIPFLMETYNHFSKNHMVHCVRDEAIWRYEISGHHKDSAIRVVTCIIETPDGEPVGYLGHPATRWGPTMALQFYGLKPGASWLQTTPSVIRYLQKTGIEYGEADPKIKDDWNAFYFHFGTEHPAYALFESKLPRTHSPYAWYVRVPDLPGFLTHISPALEIRLAESAMAGYSGNLDLNFYKTGIRLSFEEGRLKKCANWAPSTEKQGSVCFPELTFLQVLFGRNSFDDLHNIFPDCYSRTDEARALVNLLFPKKPSDVWGVV